MTQRIIDNHLTNGDFKENKHNPYSYLNLLAELV